MLPFRVYESSIWSHSVRTKYVAINVCVCFFAFQFNYSTVFHLTSKEFNKDVITLLQQQITGEPAERRLLNARLFGSRDDVRDLLQIECMFSPAGRFGDIR